MKYKLFAANTVYPKSTPYMIINNNWLVDSPFIMVKYNPNGTFIHYINKSLGNKV